VSAITSRSLWLLPGLLLGLLAGCGMYGPLYLEQEPATPEVTEVAPIAGEDTAEDADGNAAAPDEKEDDAEAENRRPEGEVGAAGRP